MSEHFRDSEEALRRSVKLSYTREHASGRMLLAASPYEKENRITFESFDDFPGWKVARLQEQLGERIPANTTVLDSLSIDLICADSAWQASDVVRVLPHRNEMTFSGAPEPVLTPYVERFDYYPGDLLVCMKDFSPELLSGKGAREALIVDEEIRTGMSMIAIVDRLRDAVRESFKIYALRAAPEGLRAIARYAELYQRSISVTVGQLAQGLDQSHNLTFSSPEKRL